MNEYTRPQGVMGGPCSHCGISQPEHVGLTCGQAKSQRSERFRAASERSSHAATLNTIKDHLQTMIASAEVYTDAEGIATAYKIKTGALHKLIGFLSLTVPVNLNRVLDSYPERSGWDFHAVIRRAAQYASTAPRKNREAIASAFEQGAYVARAMLAAAPAQDEQGGGSK